jgi:hypothetical protein
MSLHTSIRLYILLRPTIGTGLLRLHYFLCKAASCLIVIIIIIKPGVLTRCQEHTRDIFIRPKDPSHLNEQALGRIERCKCMRATLRRYSKKFLQGVGPALSVSLDTCCDVPCHAQSSIASTGLDLWSSLSLHKPCSDNPIDAGRRTMVLVYLPMR